ncbi:hypothetical protein [Sunxiuqinia elliptica]|uniref:Uncharacterized protein n=1 Tax=Sunxiuqinia elliptica TaxID=655355 RepID=A0A1I2I296_9BACT|nr:hypothetical protein [Sunxiuqinia elliptica]SFF35760.1 hypothetical protein SAMN05216283_10555 [Sunxiuqinia elliptica]
MINLENLDGLPVSFIKRLNDFDAHFRFYEFLENFANNKTMNNLISEINDYCLTHKIVGFHFTNALEQDILTHGIIIRTGQEIRASFTKNHFHLFSTNEQDQIRLLWKGQFDNSNGKNRDNRIFFNFTQHALINGGAELLLKYYGGEQVYFPLYRIPEIAHKLENIGEPMILKCSLDPNMINTFIENPWGKIIASSYHRKINPNAHTIDQDGYQEIEVKKENIEIIKLKKNNNQ